MAYSDFDLKKVRHAFGLQIDEQPDLFVDVTLVQPSAMLADTLAETAHLAMAIHTEKARSEMLITCSSTSGDKHRPRSVCFPAQNSLWMRREASRDTVTTF
jgi:hypothetical protein